MTSKTENVCWTLSNIYTGYRTGRWSDYEAAECYMMSLDNFIDWVIEKID